MDFYHRIENGIGRFLLRDGVTGEWLNTLIGEIAAHAETEAARQAAEERAQMAETRNQELQAELERLRQQLGQQ